MLTILFGILTFWNAILGIIWNAKSLLDSFIKLVFIVLAIVCGMYFLNAVGITNFNLN